MDIAELRELAAVGETMTVEFKRGLKVSDLSDREIYEAVACMANGDGGVLCLGVEDDGSITGLAPRHGTFTDPDRIAALLLNLLDPPVAARVTLLRPDDLDVLAIEIPKSPIPVGTKQGVFKRRSLKLDGTPECVPYRPQEMLSAGFALGGRDFAETVLPDAAITDLDEREFDRFRQGARTSRGDTGLASASDTEILRALRLTSVAGGVTVGAILLFGREEAVARFVPTSECLFQEFDGRQLATNDSLRGPLLRLADELYERLRVRNSAEELLVGMHRIAIPRVPDATAREAIANALVHRDYTELGPTRVQLTPHELIVSSPGTFPPGVTLDNLVTESRPRSPILADAFKRAGLVDRAGRGIPEMFSTLLRAGRGGPDYTRSNERGVTVVIPTSGSDLDLVRFVVNFEIEHGRVLTLDQLRVVHEIKVAGASSVADVADELRMPVSSTRATLGRLTEAGLVEPRGSGRHRQFHLSAGFYNLTDDRDAYVRVRGTDPLQQEQMVLNFLDAHGSITRAEVEHLCLLSGPEALALLGRLRESRAIIMQGEKRGARYVRASDEPRTTGL